MRYHLIILLNIVFLLHCFICFSQTYEGIWQGKINMGDNQLTLVFNIDREYDVYTGTLDSPDQGVVGLIIDNLKLNDSLVQIEIVEFNILFTGNIISDSSIVGTFKQSHFSFPLELKKKVYKRVRPQTPIAPFPYLGEDVFINIPEYNLQLAGTLTIPNNQGKHPAIILITGSGPQNRDEEFFDHKPFFVLADYLTRNGYAVFRYDDRGVGLSTGDYTSATTNDFMNDAYSVYNYLRTRKDIHSNKIGVLGHSEGAKIAFMLAAKNPKISFVISMAGSALQGESVLKMQNRKILQDQKFNESAIIEYCNSLREILDIKINNNIEVIKKDSLMLVYELFQEKNINEVLKSNLFSLLFFDTPWFDFYIRYNPLKDIAKVKCPVLILNGAKDVEVDAELNLNLITHTLNNNKKHSIIKYNNLNHMFQECITGQFVEYNQIEQTISPKVLSDIEEWIKKIVY